MILVKNNEPSSISGIILCQKDTLLSLYQCNFWIPFIKFRKKIHFQDIIYALLFSPLAKAQAIAPPLMAVNTIKIITFVNA